MAQNIDVRATKHLSTELSPREDAIDNPNLSKIAEHLEHEMQLKKSASQPESRQVTLEGWSDQDIQYLSEVLRVKKADQNPSEPEIKRISAPTVSTVNRKQIRFTKSKALAILFSVISIALAIYIVLFLSGWFILWSF